MKRNLLISSLILAAAVGRLPGQTTTASPPNSSASPPMVTSPDPLAQGTFSLDERLRWEYADQENLKDANAFTLRTLFGYTSAPIDGFQGMIEGGNTAVLNDEADYSAAGTNPAGAGRTTIADPATTYINQVWASYSAFDTLLKVGRQRLNLDNTRFIGDSNWRQKMQTFDAATLTAEPIKDLTLFYGYVWHVNRVFANLSPQPDFTSNSNLFNASYRGWAYGTFTTYAYLLDFANSAANSSDTYGGSFSGAAPIGRDLKITYRAEAATQSGAANNPLSYTAQYYRGDLGAVAGPVTLGVGDEELGSDHGIKGFSTPLATLHVFDGWDDEFLTTPNYGLKDEFASAGVTLPEAVPLQVIYHEFRSAYADETYGHEWDGVVSHKFGKHWIVLAKAARFYGEPLDKPTAFFSTRKFWLQTEFVY